MKTIQSRTVLFVHGAFVSYNGWDQWRTYFENLGYTTLAPPYPHKEGTPAALRSDHPNSKIALTAEKLLG
jgi:hypothetical protein